MPDTNNMKIAELTFEEMEAAAVSGAGWDDLWGEVVHNVKTAVTKRGSVNQESISRNAKSALRLLFR